MRLFAIVQWHHFAYMAISVALLGFGASGSFLFLARGWLKTRYTAAFAVNAALFGVTGLAGFALAQQVPFNALEVLWRPRQLLNLGVLYGLFVVPFFAGANCIGLALSRDGARIGAVYAANLVGSGLGALAVIGVLFLITPDDALRAAAALGLAAVVLPLLVPVSWLEPRLSPYKSLSRALAVKDAELVDTASGPLGLVSLVRSPTVPFRHLPGLSISARGEIPEQLGLFTDGDGLTAITSVPQRLEELTVLDQTAGALPY